MVAPLIPALIGAGSVAAGGIAGLMGRQSALSNIRRRAGGQGLASTAAANRAGRQAIGLSQARGSRNPNLAMRNALLANQEMQSNVAGAQASEVARAQEQLATAERQDADLLMRILMGAGTGLAGGAEAMIASDATEDKQAHQLQMLQTLMGGAGGAAAAPIQDTEFPGMATPEAAAALPAPPSQGASVQPLGTSHAPGAAGVGTPPSAGALVAPPAPSVPFVEEQRIGMNPVTDALQTPRAPLPPNGTVPLDAPAAAPQPAPAAPAPAAQPQQAAPPAMQQSPTGDPLQERSIGPLSSVFPLMSMRLGVRSFG